MAIVKHPAMSMEASGNAGGLCFSRWRGLQIVRGAWTGVVPNTPKQQYYQSALTYIAQAWSEYASEDQRRRWNELARTKVWRSRLMTPYVPSGYNLFMKWNLQLLGAGSVYYHLDPPVKEMMQGFEHFFVIYSVWTDRIRLSLRRETIEVDPYCVQYFRAGPYAGGGRRALEGEYRLVRNETDSSNWYRWFDYDVILNMWYWYKARAVWQWGEADNWFFCHGQKTAGPATDEYYCEEHS